MIRMKRAKLSAGLCRFLTVTFCNAQMELGTTQTMNFAAMTWTLKRCPLFWTLSSQLPLSPDQCSPFVNMVVLMEVPPCLYFMYASRSWGKYTAMIYLYAWFMRINLSMISSLCFYVYKVRYEISTICQTLLEGNRGAKILFCGRFKTKDALSTHDAQSAWIVPLKWVGSLRSIWAWEYLFPFILKKQSYGILSFNFTTGQFAFNLKVIWLKLVVY